MTDDRDLQRRLEQLAATGGPAAERSFAEDLDADLRVMHAEQMSTGRRRPLWVPTLAGAAVVVIAVVFAVASFRIPEDEVVVTAAADTEVILPGSVSAAASPGQRLPDGTRIVVGPDGEAVVDGVVLGPGSSAIVVGDRVDVVATVVDDPPNDGGAIDSRDRDRDDGGALDLPSTRPTTTTTLGDSDRATTRPSGRPGDGSTTTTSTRESAPTFRSTTVTRPTTASTASTSTATSAPTTTTEVREPLMLVVTAVGDARLRLDWTLDADVQPSGWRVRLGNGDRVSTLVVIRAADARSTTIERSAVGDATLWVEGLDGQGRTLVASDPASPPPP